MRKQRLWLSGLFAILMALGGLGSGQTAAPGSVKWAYSVTDDIINTSPALASDGTLYFGTLLGTFHAVNPNGTRKWVFDAEGDGFSNTSPAIGSNGTIYAPGGKEVP